MKYTQGLSAIFVFVAAVTIGAPFAYAMSYTIPYQPYQQQGMYTYTQPYVQQSYSMPYIEQYYMPQNSYPSYSYPSYNYYPSQNNYSQQQNSYYPYSNTPRNANNYPRYVYSYPSYDSSYAWFSNYYTEYPHAVGTYNGNTDLFGSPLCDWPGGYRGYDCDRDPHQWVYDPYTGSWY
jgi:hypothetical protein